MGTGYHHPSASRSYICHVIAPVGQISAHAAHPSVQAAVSDPSAHTMVFIPRCAADNKPRPLPRTPSQARTHKPHNTHFPLSWVKVQNDAFAGEAGLRVMSVLCAAKRWVSAFILFAWCINLHLLKPLHPHCKHRAASCRAFAGDAAAGKRCAGGICDTSAGALLTRVAGKNAGA